MVIEAVTGILGGKKAKKAAKKQKQIAVQVQKEAIIQAAAAKEQFALERAAVAEQRRQDRLSTIREARIRRAQILQSASSAGIGQGSSAILGGVSALQSTFGSTVGLSNVFTRLQDLSAEQQSKIMESQGKVAQLQGQSEIVQAGLQKSMANLQMWGSVASGVANLATQAFAPTRGTSFGSSEFFTSIFGGNKTTPIPQTIFGK